MSTDVDAGCKVERMSTKYDLHSLDQRLLRRRESENASLRDLSAYVGRRILAHAMEEAGMDTSAAAHYYQMVTGEESVQRLEARQALERAGVDVDEVTADFVSYQTIRKHLNACLGADTSRDDYEPAPAEDAERLARLQTRVKQVTERTVQRLVDHEAVQIGSPEALVSIKVRCGTCGRTHDIEPLLQDDHACHCGGTVSTERVESGH